MRREGVFVSLDLGSALAKSAHVRLGHGGCSILSSGISPVYWPGAGTAKAVRESLRAVAASSIPGRSGQPGRGMLAVSSTLGSPLKALVLGWKRKAAELAVARELPGSGFVVTHLVADGPGDSPRDPAHLAGDIIRESPDCIICAGPPDSAGFQPQWFMPYIMCAGRAPVLYCGGPGTLGFLRGRLGDSRVIPAELPEPGGHLPALRDAVHTTLASQAMEDSCNSRDPPFSEYERRFVSGPAAVAAALRGLQSEGFARVVYADAGSSISIAGVAGRGRVSVAIEPVGTGSGAIRALGRSAGDNGRAATELADWAANRAVRPWTVPETGTEAAWEASLAGMCLRLARRPLPAGSLRFSFGDKSLLVAGGGAFRYGRDWARMVETVVDALSPEGVFRMAVDTGDSMMHLGSIRACFGAGAESPASLLTCIGDVVVPSQPGESGEPCVTVDAGTAGRCEVRWGSTLHLALPSRVGTQVRVTPCRAASVGAGPGEAVEFEARGGLLGLVVDARIRHDPA